MQTTRDVETATPLDHDVLGLKGPDRRLGWLSGILAVAVLVLGALLIFSDDSGQSLTAEQGQMVETIDAYLEFWNTGDGAGAAALVAASGYHDNGGTKYSAGDGELSDFIERVHGQGFSVSRTGEAAFVGDYVMTTEHIPADSTTDRPAIYYMSSDGTKILWHFAP